MTATVWVQPQVSLNLLFCNHVKDKPWGGTSYFFFIFARVRSAEIAWPPTSVAKVSSTKKTAAQAQVDWFVLVRVW